MAQQEEVWANVLLCQVQSKDDEFLSCRDLKMTHCALGTLKEDHSFILLCLSEIASSQSLVMERGKEVNDGSERICMKQKLRLDQMTESSLWPKSWSVAHRCLNLLT